LKGDHILWVGPKKLILGHPGKPLLGKMVSLRLLKRKMSGKRGEDTHRERGHFRLALKGTICLGLNRRTQKSFCGRTSIVHEGHGKVKGER